MRPSPATLWLGSGRGRRPRRQRARADGQALAEVVPLDISDPDPAQLRKPRWPLAALVAEGWTYIRREGEVREGLFHLSEDPGETRNLARDPANQRTVDGAAGSPGPSHKRTTHARPVQALTGFQKKSTVERRGDAVLIDSTLPKPGTRRLPAHQRAVSPMTVLLLAISCGLLGGYLDLVFIVFKKFLWNGLKNYANAHDFPWTVPVGHVALLLIPAALLAVVNGLRPKPISLRAATWLFTTLAIWAALLRLPLYGVCSLLLATGLGRLMVAISWPIFNALGRRGTPLRG